MKRLSHFHLILLFATAAAAAGCSSGKKTQYPEVENLELKYSFEENATRRYRATCTLVSSTGSSVLSGRNLAIVWTQKVVEVSGDGLARIENTIDDVVFETEKETASAKKDGPGSTIRGALKGMTFELDVTPRGIIKSGKGTEVDWEEAFREYFETAQSPPGLQDFIVSMARLNFSERQILAVLAFPFRAMPEKPVSGRVKWEEIRKVPVFGILADTNIAQTIMGFESLGEKTSLVIHTGSEWIEGSASLNVPAKDMPMVMEIAITGGEMIGELHFDPEGGVMLQGKEKYDLYIETKAGLPSLKEGESLSGPTEGIKLTLQYSTGIELID
ncbi:MAG: hypothetical protein ABIJ56_13650 [Pseudomonadota bacterium]